VVNESHPREGGHPWFRYRREAEDILLGGREVKVRAAPPWLVRLLALVSPKLRPVVPLAPHYARPMRYDTAKLRGLLGEVERTPLAEGVAAPLDWLAASRQRR
jgi:nucleoside-diphosphate-sugar epimerase